MEGSLDFSERKANTVLSDTETGPKQEGPSFMKKPQMFSNLSELGSGVPPIPPPQPLDEKTLVKKQIDEERTRIMTMEERYKH